MKDREYKGGGRKGKATATGGASIIDPINIKAVHRHISSSKTKQKTENHQGTQHTTMGFGILEGELTILSNFGFVFTS
jgi:hypothetical protein